MIDFTTPRPLADAVARLSERTPLGSMLRTAEWERLPVALRERAFFSAGVENVRFLEEARDRLLDRIGQERAQGVVMDRARFVRDMKELADDLGLRPEDPDERGGLRDVGSQRRLQLIWDTQTAMAEGYSRWRTDMDPDVLDAVPAQELIRIGQRRIPRDWPIRWNAAREALGDATTALMADPSMLSVSQVGGATGMIALKTDPIWRRLSRFGTPWPPFDFGSGMGLRNVRRSRAERLGLLDRDEEVVPLDVPFNEGLEASARGISPAGRQRLFEFFGSLIEIVADRIMWKGGLP